MKMSNGYSESEQQERVLETVRRESVRFVHLQFMDILGNVKTVTIPAAKLMKAIEDGAVFDGSSVVGYATIEESDMRAKPDLSTFKVLPWSHPEMREATIICNIYDSKGNRFGADPRYILERVLKKAGELGYECFTGPEYEFFLFQLDNDGKPTTLPSDKGRYFDMMPLDKTELVRDKISLYLDALGFDVETTHHEVANGQHEIDLRYADAMTSADRVMALKSAIKTVALENGLHATFMPKPVAGQNGSGMHVHQSLFTTGGENAFYDESGIHELSDVARWYVGGVLKYARETCAILASWVNSYKRLVPGYEAPVYICWANKNRSALVRIPAGKGKSKRIEVRNPDPAGNPYLQYAVMLAAGLEGVRNKLEPPQPIETDIFKLTSSDRSKMGIGSLPGDLNEALAEMEKSELIRETIGAHVFTNFLYNKRKEWDSYKIQVTDWELKQFLSL